MIFSIGSDDMNVRRGPYRKQEGDNPSLYNGYPTCRISSSAGKNSSYFLLNIFLSKLLFCVCRKEGILWVPPWLA